MVAKVEEVATDNEERDPSPARTASSSSHSHRHFSLLPHSC
ncbi:hypothetical protein MUK42_10016 [Musa troglodytarum]|uniref:Uncharacterized protein n=1 Tax=Musa troglodytarum TaxID=320322 RepID=A0A9E7JA84_9LILI|nr:hypothetical protein MUK42_10016 [Musa troglodytarum]